MATECRQDSFDFGTVAGRAVVGALNGGVISSDAGGLLLGATDKAIGLVGRLAGCFRDGRKPEVVLTLVGGPIAPANRRRAPIPGKLGVFPFIGHRPAGEGVHDPRPPALLKRIQDPTEECVGLVAEADAAQCEDC
jgi:hypothetical protein